MMIASGTKLGHYEIHSKIGAGGMGEVYLAEDTKLNRKVAVKLLPAESVADERAKKRLMHEAQAAAALDHSNICAIYEVGEEDGHAFIVMQYVEGETLQTRMKRQPLQVSESLSISTQVADALVEAHAHGIVHRDIKPSNIMLTPRGQVKVMDFGLAKVIPQLVNYEAQTQSLLSEPGTVLGTVPYMSPEQVSGEHVDARSDIFSFGAVLYEMLSGHEAFAGDSAAATISAILTREPAPLAKCSREVPGDLEVIVNKALRKDRGDRYQTINELLVDLKDLNDKLERAGTEWARTREGGLRSSARVATVAVAALLLIGALGMWRLARRVQAENERKTTVAEMEHLVDMGRFVDAWRIGTAALQRWPGDPQLEHPMSVTTQPVTITTDPPGAEVAFKAYEDVSGDWIPLGTTPLNAIRAPIGQLRWRITKAGFAPLEARLEVGAPAAAAGRPDVNAAPIRLRPVGSDLGRMVFVPGGKQAGVDLTDFWIDQFEVTNREFKDFVDQGGYQDPRYWTQPKREMPQLHDEPSALFRDRTGRPGPSTWELGTYPEGKDDYPVSGVSWFEAAAYCQFRANSLPTVFHWRKAFGDSFFLEVLTLGNFGGQGPEATGQLKEVGPFGTVGMAGNVKEWVWNEFQNQRYILGGAWNEPVYMAVDNDMRPALDRAETNGFRCIKETTPSEETAYAQYDSERSPRRDFTKEKPVDAATFDVFRRFYSYDRTPLESKIERTEESEHWRRERVSYAAAYGGERVFANILIPKNATPPYQAVIWFPGS